MLIGSNSISTPTNLTTIGTAATNLYTNVNIDIDGVDPATTSFVKYGTSGETGVHISYRFGMLRTVGISATQAEQTRTITFTSNVN